QAAQAVRLHETATATAPFAGRERWSAKLRADHRIIAALESLMNQLGPAETKVPVKSVAKVLPFIGIVIGAGMNSQVLRSVAADAQRYCPTRFLSEKYGREPPERPRQIMAARDSEAEGGTDGRQGGVAGACAVGAARRCARPCAEHTGMSPDDEYPDFVTDADRHAWDAMSPECQQQYLDAVPYILETYPG